MIDALKAYANTHYEAGGHWIAETYGQADYERALAEAGGDIEAAKAMLEKAWLFLVEREAEAGDY
jgi:hypothetical protein